MQKLNYRENLDNFQQDEMIIGEFQFRFWILRSNFTNRNHAVMAREVVRFPWTTKSGGKE